MSPEAGVLVLGRGHIDSIVKIILKFIFLLLIQIRQTEDIVMMPKKGSTKFVNFWTLRPGG